MSSSRTARRVRVAVVFDGYVPEYRRRLYELLDERSDVEYVVFWGRKPSNLASAAATGPYAFSNVRVRNYELRAGRKVLIYQPLVREILTGRYDAIIIGAWLRLVSSLVVAPLFKLRRKPVIFWGQGFDKREDFGPLMRSVLEVAIRIKIWMVGCGDGYLAYTEGGRDRLITQGLEPERVFPIYNTLDTEEQTRLHREVCGDDRARLRTELGFEPASTVFLYVGSIYREKRFEQLLEAIDDLRARGIGRDRIELAVIGGGPELEAMQAAATGIDGIHFRGEVMDQLEVARHLRVSAAVVIPGGIGLAVNHAFAQGRPVITRADAPHGPEVEYLVHGRNGLIVEGDLKAFASALADFAGDESEQMRLAEGALATRDEVSIERMAERFDNAVHALLGLDSGSAGAADRPATGAALAQASAHGRESRPITIVDASGEPETAQVGDATGH